MAIGNCSCGNRSVPLYPNPRNSFLMVCSNCRMAIQQEVIAENQLKAFEKMERARAEDARRSSYSNAAVADDDDDDAYDFSDDEAVDERESADDDAGLWNSKGLSLYRDEKYAEAAALFSIAIDKKDCASFRNNRGHCYRLDFQLDNALTDFNAAIRLAPQDRDVRPKCYHGRGMVLDALSLFVAAKADFMTAFELGYEAAGKDIARLSKNEDRSEVEIDI